VKRGSRRNAAADKTSQERQLVLLRSLTARRRGITVKELARELEVTDRTIRRDFMRLRRGGVPLVEEAQGTHGGKAWRLAESARLPAVTFTWDEAAVLYLARQLLEPLAGTGLWHAAHRAMKKVRGTLTKDSIEYLDRFPRLVDWNKGVVADYTAKAPIIDQIMVAIEDSRAIKISYQSQQDERPAERDVHPYAFTRHTLSGALYLVGFAPKHDRIRSYKVNRVHAVETCKLKFQKPADFDPAQYLADSFGIYDGDEDVTVVIEFKKPAARFVEETLWHTSQVVDHRPDGRVRVTFRLSSTVEVKSFVLGFGENAVVIKPESLRSEVAAELARMIDAYQKGPAEA
jgi:predicted DNA-binding transcriptional regulator YafY